MSYTKELVKVLRKAADRLDDAKNGDGPDDYQWQDTQRCNCGFVAQVAMDMNSVQLGRAMHPYHNGSWTCNSNTACPTTGIPINTVFEVLHQLGLRREDYHRIEFLADDELRELAGIEDPDGACSRDGNHGGDTPYARKGKVAEYLRVFAKKIEKEIKERDKTAALLKSVRKALKMPLPKMEVVERRGRTKKAVYAAAKAIDR